MVNFKDLRLNGREPVYIQIASYIKRMILIGKAINGDILPSRRELAATMEVTPNTVQKAYKLMEDEGYITTPQNATSMICYNKQIFEKIEHELTRGLVVDFVKAAKENNISFKRTVELLTDIWYE